MKTTVEDMRRVLEILAPVVPSKSTLPITANVLLQEGKAISTDLTVAAQMVFPAAKEPLLIPHRLVSAALHHIAGSTPLEVSTETGPRGSEVVFHMGKATLRYPMGRPDEYPPIPQVDGEVDSWEVAGDALLHAMREVLPYCATDDSRPVLACVCLTLGEPAVAVGADGFRLAIKQLPFNMPSEGGTNLLVPTGAVRVLAHVWDLVDKIRPPTDGSIATRLMAKPTIRVTDGQHHLKFHLGDAVVTVSHTTGTYPGYRTLVPTHPSWTVRVNSQELYAAVQGLAPLANAGSGIVRLAWAAGGPLMLTAMAEDSGSMEVALHATVTGEAGQIAFNVQYLLDYLKGLDALVTLEGTSPYAPAIWRHHIAPLLVLMPMSVGGVTPPPQGSTEGSAPEDIQATEDEGPPPEQPEGQDGPGEEKTTPVPARPSRARRTRVKS